MESPDESAYVDARASPFPSTSQLAPTKTKRQHAIEELVETEQAYRSDLEALCTVYLPIARGTYDLSHAPALPVLDEDDIRIIFSNVEELFHFSTAFVAILREAAGSDFGLHGNDAIGSSFIDMIPRLQSTYQPYISRHSDALIRLEILDDNLQDYIAHARSLSTHLTSSWNLNALLIKPIQRILKYPLLLDAILSQTVDGHPDKSDLETAHTKMVQLAQTLNESKRSYELVSGILAKSLPKSSSSTRLYSPRDKTSRKATAVLPTVNSSPKLGVVMGKTFGRTKQRLKQAAGFSSNTSSADALEAQDILRSLISQLDTQHLLISSLEYRMQDFAGCLRRQCTSNKRLLQAWVNIFSPLTAEEATDERLQNLPPLEEYAMLINRIEEGPLNDLDQHVKTRLPMLIAKVLLLFQGPSAIIQKRSNKLLDAQRQRQEDAGKKFKFDVNPNYQDDAEALTLVLLNELPTFLSRIAVIGQLLVMEAARLQALYFFRISQLFHNFVESQFGANSCQGRQFSPIVKKFWMTWLPLSDAMDAFNCVSKSRVDDLSDKALRRLSLPALPVAELSSFSLEDALLASDLLSKRRQTAPLLPVNQLETPTRDSGFGSIAGLTPLSQPKRLSAIDSDPAIALCSAIAVSNIENSLPGHLEVTAGEELDVLSEEQFEFVVRNKAGQIGLIKQSHVVCFR